jgi:2-octaprenyl-3-methyl-6-methoxy-1,4-benzoquinol hydroxylase/2-octaprenylphenol hydroxylase
MSTTAESRSRSSTLGTRSRRNTHDVAIVGAGMVGATLALKLARDGFDVAVIEPRPPAPWRSEDDVDLRVVALAPSSVRLLDDVGAWPAIAAARACAYRRMRVWDALAPGSLGFDSADDGTDTLGWIVENKLIQDHLWQALDAAGIVLHCPARVVATRIDGDRRSLELEDGTAVAARLVVAADGGESPLREQVGIVTRDRDYGQRAIAAHVVTEHAHESTAWQRFLPGATIAFLPLGQDSSRPVARSAPDAFARPMAEAKDSGQARPQDHDLRAPSADMHDAGARAGATRCSIVWSVPNREAERLLALDDAAFCAELGAAFDFRLGRIVSTTPRAAFPLRLRLAERYLAPNFALVGDAAHVVHPLAGQGVNLGLRDAAELADVLAAARAAGRDFAAAASLRRYERRRRSDNVLSANAFDAIQRVFGSEAMPVAALRGAGLALVDAIGPLKRAFARHAAGR